MILGLFGVIAAAFGGKWLLERGKEKAKKQGEVIGANNEAVRRENAGKAAELDIAKKDAAIDRAAEDARILAKDALRDRLAREPTEAEVRDLIAESKRSSK